MTLRARGWATWAVWAIAGPTGTLCAQTGDTEAARAKAIAAPQKSADVMVLEYMRSPEANIAFDGSAL